MLCDDHRVFAECLGQLLVRHGVRVTAVTWSIDHALSVLTRAPVDVLVLDISFPEGRSVTRLAEIRRASPRTRIVLLSAETPPLLVRAALADGASGIVAKSQSARDLVVALERVHRGEVVVDSALLIAAMSGESRHASPDTLLRFLTDREREVLDRLVRGETTQVIAAGLGVRTSTARTHIQSVLTKLGVHSRLEAAALAVREGMAASH